MAIVDGLITLEEARASLGWSAADVGNNDDLERYIEAVTPLIENVTGPIIQHEIVYRLDGGSDVLLLPVPFQSITSVTVDGASVVDFDIDGDAGIVFARDTAFGAGIRNVVVTAQIGLPAVPPNVKLAARETVRVLWQQGRQGNRPSFGNNADAEVTVPMTFALPRRAIELLAPHARLGGFA